MLIDQSGDSRVSGTSTRVKRGRLSLKPIATGIGLLLLITASFGNAFASMPAAPLAATAPSLGNAQSFAVLGASTVTNTGPSVITGDLGVSPGTAVTGFPPGLVIAGAIHSADTLAGQAQADVTTAYNALAAQTCTTTFTPPTDLGGKILVPGVYCFGSSAALTGVLTFDGQNDPNAVWVFKIGSAITTATGSSMVFIRPGPGPSCNVFWQVTSSATLGTSSQFAGNILALTSITMNTSARLSGRALARNGAVTLDSNNISAAPCVASIGATATAVAAATATATAGVAATATAGTAATATALAVPPTATPNQCLGNIRGRKVNGSGTGLAGWTIQLMQGGQIIQSVVTDAAGNFNFLGLPMGAYVIQEVAQNGWVAQTPSSINVTLGACNQNLTGYTFVNAAAATAVPQALTATPAALLPTAVPVGSASASPAGHAVAATPAATAIVPRSLPNTGDSPTSSGLLGLLFGAILVLMGVGIARRSHR